MKKLTILIDMDDTITDLLGVWVKRVNRMYGTTVKYSDVKQWEITSTFPTLTSEQIFKPLHNQSIWEEVKPFKGSVKYIEKLVNDGHKVYVVTNSHYSTVKPKMEKFLKKFFPFLAWENVIITSCKQMIRGDILIDDAVHNLIGGGYVKFLMDAPPNRAFNAEENGMIRVHNWKEIYDLINEIARGCEYAKCYPI